MDENTSLINIGELSRPATVLIEKFPTPLAAYSSLIKSFESPKPKRKPSVQELRAKLKSLTFSGFVEYVLLQSDHRRHA